MFGAVGALTTLANFIALSIVLDAVDLCNGLGYVSWAPWVVLTLPMSIVMPPSLVVQMIEQHCSSRALRRLSFCQRTLIINKERDAIGVAAGLGVRESRWDTQREFSGFLVSLPDDASTSFLSGTCLTHLVVWITESQQGGGRWRCQAPAGPAVGPARSARVS